MTAQIVHFPTTPARAASRERVLADTAWTRRIQAEFKARWQGRHRPLVASAWHHHVGQWRSEYPLCAPENAPWDALWVTFKVRCPAAREGRGAKA